jgi:hypothetical protein
MTPRVRRRLGRAATTIPVRKVRITDDLVMITADTWTVHGHLDPLVDALTAVAEAARADSGVPRPACGQQSGVDFDQATGSP